MRARTEARLWGMAGAGRSWAGSGLVGWVAGAAVGSMSELLTYDVRLCQVEIMRVVGQFENTKNETVGCA